MNANPKRLAFKYRSGDEITLPRDLRDLEQSRIFAASRGSLNDPFEGRFNRSTLDAQIAKVRAFVVDRLRQGLAGPFAKVEESIEEILGFVDKSGVFSLSYTPLDELLWAHYGGCHRGFCVGYDLDRLVEFDPQNLHCMDVQYLDAAPSLHGNDLFLANGPPEVLRKILGTKSTPWKYEQEVRVIATPVGHHDHDFRAVKEVYFGLRCPEETRLAVMKCLEGRGVTYKQVSSAEPSYTLQADVIADAYGEAPPFRRNLAPLESCAILTSHLKPEQQPYAEYLTKAAEIVRRDPYCKAVELVDFSGSRSKPDQPVIFVNYLHTRGPDKWAQRHFTLPEIDEEYGQLET